MNEKMRVKKAIYCSFVGEQSLANRGTNDSTPKNSANGRNGKIEISLVTTTVQKPTLAELLNRPRDNSVIKHRRLAST